MSKSDQRLQDEGSRRQVLIAGATAGLISRFVVAPLDVVKIRLQLQSHSSLSDPLSHAGLGGGSPIYKGTVGTLKHIVRHEGVTALWKGNVPAEMMYVAYASIQFTTYRSMTQLLRRALGEDSPLPHAAESFISGASAGATATASTYPLDLLRTRFAAQGNDRVYPSLWRAVRDIRRDEGPRGFFRGLAPALALIVPSMGLFFAVYEGARVPLSRLELPGGASDAAAGMLASVVAKTGVFPLDLVRKRIQVQGPTRSRYVHKNIPEYAGTASTVRTILAREGARGLYRGLTVSLIKAAPASAVTMWTYERTLNFLRQGDEKKKMVDAAESI
ncbi:mitochondrial thiamine pyrophosphate carrier 1 [Hypoxylon rubiginosum]|uniref:Mitochondrial thiamine pyrophosphate carrier 1 n=1 Tax=Hypoxylon rubiginosum TaxID=110542 RepID=A0ACB9YNJ1_9PEZI|nr:mitochondrial thiamine pyrophosphate carrier 1 [Hypoxylon rubiginosum]